MAIPPWFRPGCSVTLKNVGLYPARVIHSLKRDRLDLSIPQVKELLQQLPLRLAEGLTAREADDLARTFIDAGAEVEVYKPSAKISDWLQKQCSLDEVKTEDRSGFVDGPVWQALMERMQPGDEIWTFSSPDYFWENMCGRAGYAIVRDGRVISHVLTSMN